MRRTDFDDLSATAIKCFINSARVIVAITLITKVITLIQHPKVLDLADAVTSLRFVALTEWAAVVEVMLLGLLCFRPSDLFKILAILYFSLVTGSYRIVAYMADQKWCPCLGNFGTWASLNEQQVSGLLNAVVIYLFLGAMTALVLMFNDFSRKEQSQSVL